MNQIENINDATESTETIVERIEADGQLILDGMPEPIEETKVVLTLDAIIEQIIESLGWTKAPELTLYQLHKLVNGVLVVLDAKKINSKGVLADYRVSSQMMYTYAGNGMVVKGRKTSETITVDQAAAFTKKFTAKFVR